MGCIDTNWLKECKKTHYAKINLKEAGVATLISSKVDFSNEKIWYNEKEANSLGTVQKFLCT